MITNDLKDKAVIVTGGTKGIGLAVGQAFARVGAHVYLTNRWESVDPATIASQFAQEDLRPPEVFEADVSNDEDTEALLAHVRRDHDRVEALITNACFAHVSKSPNDLTAKRLASALEYSTWPFVGYVQAIREIFGTLPRYSIGMSSRGPEYFIPGYEYVAAAKAAMETYCRYLSAELRDEDIRINIVRSNPVPTESLRSTLGEEFEAFGRKYFGEDYFVTPDEVANATLALCSGLMDSVKGQVLLLDHGLALCDNLPRLFAEREQLKLE